MLTRLTLLAALEKPDEQALQDVARRTKSWFSSDTGLLLGALILVVAVALFWVLFLRRRPSHQRGSLVLERAPKDPENQRYGASGKRRRRKRRPEHPDNLGRNPTLGETGGLPPPRPEDEQEPPPSESTEPQR